MDRFGRDQSKRKIFEKKSHRWTDSVGPQEQLLKNKRHVPTDGQIKMSTKKNW